MDETTPAVEDRSLLDVAPCPNSPYCWVSEALPGSAHILSQ